MSTFTLEGAYIYLNINNGSSLADEDVGVALYKTWNLNRELHGRERNALECIVEARKSRFLRFLAIIGEQLNEKNVAVLAKKTCESSGSKMEMDAYGEYYATSEDSPSEPRSPSSPEASVSSSDGMNADSDFSEEVGGIFFDRYVWRCEEYLAALVERKCPNGHDEKRCKTCGWQLDNGPCQKCLGRGGACDVEKVDGRWCNCEAGEESEDEDTIIFDERDLLWRCISCQWEVEADNETDGNCHCLNDKNEAHFIDLSDCLDYEPADSCSSEDDSIDSEPNRDDEGFIDDAEIPMDDAASSAAIEAVNLAALYPARDIEDILKKVERAKARKLPKDKENVEPTASSDDIEVIDPPTSNRPPTLPSNIIDCESMDI